MNNKIIYLIAILIVVIAVIFYVSKRKHKMVYKVNNIEDLNNLFPKNPSQIKQFTQKCMNDVEENIRKILEIPNEKRNFENTAQALDKLNSFIIPASSGLSALEQLSPEKSVRDAAHDAILKLTDFLVDKVTMNVELYKAFKYYIENNAKNENLNDVEKYYLSEAMADYKRSGLDLPADKLNEVKKLAKELAGITLEYETNIAQHKCEVIVSLKDLDGLEKEFIDALPKTKNGEYILGCDYPTYFNVMDNAKVESTRKALYLAFYNRAYPKNISLLEQMIAKRDQLAKLVGYESYANMTFDNQMAKNPQTVEKFLNNLMDKAIKKEKKEIEEFKKDLPSSVTLTKDGKIKPWDLRFLKTNYKKKYLNLDEQEVSEYFPMEHTVKALLEIYEKFLNLQFKEVPISGFWHQDVKLIEAHDKDTDKLLGYIFLDLYPRDNKFSHAANSTIVPCVVDKDGNSNPSVSIIMANFPKSTKNQPSLLMLKDVVTFFHEFGHAIHALMGCTQMYSFSGTAVKTDFVEMPSQMLEDWLRDEDILKIVSKNYKTGKPLPNDMIQKIINLEKFDSGNSTLTQIFYSLLSLEYYKNGAHKDDQAILQNLAEKVMKNMQWDPNAHLQANFGHLTGYGASYYGYLWSKVFAKDLYHEIKKQGLLNPEIGKKYAHEVIGKGGSQDPNMILKNFLGRVPNEQAFMKDLGFVD